MTDGQDIITRLADFGKLWNDLKANAKAKAKEYQDYEDKLWDDYVSNGKRPPEDMVQALYRLREARDKAQQVAHDAPGEFVRSYGSAVPVSPALSKGGAMVVKPTERLHLVRVYTPVDKLLVSGSVKKPANGDTLVWQVYNFDSRRWVEKQRAQYGTPEGNTLFDALNERYATARANEGVMHPTPPAAQSAGMAAPVNKPTLVKAKRGVPPRVGQPVSKEPWQMTREEWVMRNKAKPLGQQAPSYDIGKAAKEAKGKVGTPEWQADYHNRIIEYGEAHATWQHGDLVKRAIHEGKPVPAEVLAEYPDLAAKVQAVSQPRENTTAEAARGQATLDNTVGLHPDYKSWRRFLGEFCALKGEARGWKHYVAVNSHYFVDPEGNVHEGDAGFHGKNNWKDIRENPQAWLAERDKWRGKLRAVLSRTTPQPGQVEIQSGGGKDVPIIGKQAAVESYAGALKLEHQRSPMAKARDETHENAVVVPRSKMTPKKLKSWENRPGRFDIQGVDTPRKRKPRLSR
jgi:hypothetical protein